MTALDDRLHAARSALRAGVRPSTPTPGTIARRRRHRRTGLGGLLLGALALVTAAVVVPSDGERTTSVSADAPPVSSSVPDDPTTTSHRVDGPSTTAAPGGPDDVERADALGPGSWLGARTSSDRTGLVIQFVGGPEYRAGDSCTVAYRAERTENETDVRVRILARSPGPGGGACQDMGHLRSVEVELDRPLAGRALIEEQFGRERPVFDGAVLLEPGWLPEGWTAQGEGPGYPDPEAVRYWSRTWGPSSPDPIAEQCTPGEQPVTLTQGPADLLDRYPSNGEQPVASFEVRGQQATYFAGGAATISRLAWTEGETGFVLSASPGCVGDAPPAPELLVRIADSLVAP